MTNAPRQTGPVQVAVGVVVRRPAAPRSEPWILVAHRFSHVHLPDYWEFPGGKVEPGEESALCAVREVLEETGLVVRARGLLARQRHAYSDREVEIDFHVCEYHSGVPAPLHCQAVRWVVPRNLAVYQFPNANQEVLDRLADHGWLDRQ